MFPLFASLALYFHQFIAPWTSIKGYFYNYFTFHCCWSLLFVCLPLSLSVSIIWYDYISITCRCILSPKTNTKRRSICYNKQNLISNFRYVYEYYSQLHMPMFSFRTFEFWWFHFMMIKINLSLLVMWNSKVQRLLREET